MPAPGLPRLCAMNARRPGRNEQHLAHSGASGVGFSRFLSPADDEGESQWQSSDARPQGISRQAAPSGSGEFQSFVTDLQRLDSDIA
jgi:hypothetical protein